MADPFPTGKWRPWKVTIGGQQVTIAVFSTDSPDSFGGGSDMFMITGRKGGQSGTGGVPVNADYLVCAQIIGYTFTNNVWVPNLGTPINVAKQVHMRRSIAVELYYGAKLSYANVNGGDIDNQRTTTDPQNNVTAGFAYPPYMTMNDVAALYPANQIPSFAQCVISATLTLHGTGIFTTNNVNSAVMWQETTSRDWTDA